MQQRALRAGQKRKRASFTLMFMRFLYRLNCLRWRITRPVTLGVRLILVQDGAVVLVKHTYQPHWYLPGGGVKRGETLEAAAHREAAEELGARLGALALFGVYTNFYEHKSDHVIVFICHDFMLTGSSSREIAACALFSLDALPEDISPGSLRRLREYEEHSGLACVSLW